MTTDNLPAIRAGLLPEVQEFQMFQTIARSAKNSGLYGGDENKIFMVLLAARELGIPPLLALNGGLWNIQGKIEISARLMNSMIRRAGHTMKITSTRIECTIVGKRADTGEEHTEIFSMEMAITAGLANGNVWKKYPEDMLYNRCMSRLARRLFPDVIGTAYVEGEIREAKEVEKEIQQTQYEDITPIQNDNHDENQNDSLPKISDVQHHELATGIAMLGAVTKKHIDEEIKRKFNIDALEDLPESEFQNYKNKIDYALEMKRQKDMDNANQH